MKSSIFLLKQLRNAFLESKFVIVEKKRRRISVECNVHSDFEQHFGQQNRKANKKFNKIQKIITQLHAIAVNIKQE